MTTDTIFWKAAIQKWLDEHEGEESYLHGGYVDRR